MDRPAPDFTEAELQLIYEDIGRDYDLDEAGRLQARSLTVLSHVLYEHARPERRRAGIALWSQLKRTLFGRRPGREAALAQLFRSTVATDV